MTDSRVVLSAAAVARARSLGEPRWSPDGAHLAWLEVDGGTVDLVVVPTDGGAPPLQVTAEVPVTKLGAYGGGGFCWAPTQGRAGHGQPYELVYAAADGRLVAIAPVGGPVRVLADGAADGSGASAAAPAVAPGGDRVAFVWETAATCVIAVVPLAGGAPPSVVSSADYAWDPAWSPDGAALVWHEWDLPAMPWDASRVVLARPDDPHDQPVVVAGGGDVAVGQPRFSPDGAAVAFVSDASGWMNVWVAAADGTDARLLLDDTCEHAEPAWGPGQRSYSWSPDGLRIALCRNEEGFGRLVVVDVGTREVRERSKGWHHGLDWGTAGIVCVRSGARTAPQVTVLDPAADGSRGRRVLARGASAELDALDLPEPEPVTWRADDGSTVHGILWRPVVPGGDRPPLLVEVHGGPTGQAVVGWAPRVQWFLSRGWAVLAPNPRGSTGYGRAYLRALDAQWGVAEVADTVAGIRAAGERSWADPARVAVMGDSAGGFTALLVGAAAPVVRAVVSQYGVTDLIDLAATTHRFESRYLDTLVGPLPEASDAYIGRSPVTRAAAVTAPVLVLQGDADKVVPPAQAVRLADALRAAGAPVELHVYEGEGHGWSRPETVIDALGRIEAFLTKWLTS